MTIAACLYHGEVIFPRPDEIIEWADPLPVKTVEQLRELVEDKKGASK